MGAPLSEGPRRAFDMWRMTRNMGSLGVGYLVRQALGFAAVTYVAHRIGPQGFGWINFSAAILGYFGLLATLGIPTWSSRQLARQVGTDAFSRTLGAAFTARLGLALAAAGLALLMSPLLVTSPPMKVVFLLLTLNLVVVAGDLQWAFAGLENLTVPAVAQVLGGAFELLLVRLQVRGPGDIVWAVVATLAGGVVVALIEVPWLVRHARLRLARPGGGVMRSMVRSTLPFALATVMLAFFYNMDSVLLGYMKDARAVGYFNAAYKIVLFLNGLTLVYVQAVYPVASRLFVEDRRRLRPFLARAASLALAAILPVGIGGVILAPQIIGWVYGRAYLATIPAFQILVWSGVLLVMEVHYSFGLLAADRERIYIQGILGGAALNLVANVLLIPPLGTDGAALATVLAEGAVLVYMALSARGPLGSFGPGWRTVAKAAANAALMAVVSWLLAPRLPVGAVIAVSALVYGSLILVTRTVSFKELGHLVRQARAGGRGSTEANV